MGLGLNSITYSVARLIIQFISNTVKSDSNSQLLKNCITTSIGRSGVLNTTHLAIRTLQLNKGLYLYSRSLRLRTSRKIWVTPKVSKMKVGYSLEENGIKAIPRKVRRLTFIKIPTLKGQNPGSHYKSALL